MADTMQGPRGTAGAGEAPVSARTTYDDDRGAGWLTFAGTMLVIVGIMNSIYGIAAISDSKFFVHGTKYVFGSLNTWGWFLLIVGVIQILAAFSIWGRTTWGVWVGVLAASVNAMLQLLDLPAYPFLSLTLFAVDILIIYGLVAYGGRRRTA
jgi:hypothetical protein